MAIHATCDRAADTGTKTSEEHEDCFVFFQALRVIVVKFVEEMIGSITWR